MKRVETTGSSLRDTINELAEQLISDLQKETLTPTEKLSFLKALLPYAVGKLPNAALNYDYSNGQPTSARVIEPTKDGGRTDKKTWDELVASL